MLGRLAIVFAAFLVTMMAGCRGSADTAVGGHARDPICGSIIEVTGQPEFLYRDTRFHFCSSACLDKFVAAPSTATTGLPHEQCVCLEAGSTNCGCSHCIEWPKRCECADPHSTDGTRGHGHGH